MTRTREKVRGRKTKRRVYALHHDVVKHPNWVRLSPYAKLLWLEFGLEYNTVNNGWLALPYRYLIKERGFRSRSTISRALDELLHYQFLRRTYPGSIKECARYALTHLDLNDHPEGLVRAMRAPHTYRTVSEPYRPPKKSSSPPADTSSPPGEPVAPHFTSNKGSSGPTGEPDNSAASAGTTPGGTRG